MTFYNNSVVEWRPSGTDCFSLTALSLADGLTGADAIAAGWWTSFWQVPVLLHNGTDVLPFETAEALQTLNISNLVILGGECEFLRPLLRKRLNSVGREFGGWRGRIAMKLASKWLSAWGLVGKHIKRRYCVIGALFRWLFGLWT